jgi:predicted AAA+ superfamily ATPase
MNQIIQRNKAREKVSLLLKTFPVTAILGPRQVGKTTLARTFNPDYIFDLENPRDFVALQQPQIVLEQLNGLIMIDEIQRKPDLFPLLRYLVDQNNNQKFLILGSSSSDLRNQSGESLAGRIGYYYLTGFNLAEAGADNLHRLWLRGGFPRAFLAESDTQSDLWRNNFISTFLEKDLGIYAVRLSPPEMYRFWMMLSHYHGQTLNYSELSRSLGISDKVVKHFTSVLEDAFMIRQLLPWHVNLGKRLVKSPKLYIRDSGIFHTLQSINSYNQVILSPKAGASWEGFVIEELVNMINKRDKEVFYYGTHGGAELDLYWQYKGYNLGVEVKYLDAPSTTKSMHQALEDLQLHHLWVIYPGNKSYPLSEKISVCPLEAFSNDIRLRFGGEE